MMFGHNGGPAIRDAGWYATHRDMLNHPIVGICQPVKPEDPKRGSASRFEAWHWLIANAAFAEREWINKGQRQTIRAGQLVAGRRYLAHTWNWSEKTVRVFLAQLLNEQMITLATDQIRGQRRANTANIISLCNYLRYQLSDDEQKEPEGPAKGQPGASEGPAKGHIDNKDTTTQDSDNPPTPQGGGGDRKTSKREIARIAFVEWQEFAKAHDLSVPRDTSFNDIRARDIYARMAEHAGPSPTGEALLAVWRDALVNVAKSKMLRGMTEIAFRADLTFLCQRKSFTKLIEGGYGNGACASDARWHVAGGSHASKPDWSSWNDAEWQRQIEKHGVEYWPVDKLAGPPGSKTYSGPKAMEPSLCEVYRPDGMRRQR